MADFYDTARTIDSSGVALRVAQFGPDDGIPVLLLHGWPDSAKLWEGQIGPLTNAGYRVIAPDQRGFGGSDKPDDVADYSLFNFGGDAVAVLDALECPTAHVVGHDWGAAMAWTLAMFSPERFRSLTALSVGHPSAFRAGGLEQRRLSWYMLAFQFEGIAEEWLTRDDSAALREFLDSHRGLEAVMANMEAPGALTASLNIYRANVSAASLLGPATELPSVGIDTMGIWSSADLALTESQMTTSGDHVTGEWRYERIEGASHWMQLDARDRVNELLLEWLGRD